MTVHRRLWNEAGGVRSGIAAAVGAGLAGVALVIAQAHLIAHVVTAGFLGRAGLAALGGPLVALAAVAALRAISVWGVELGGGRCAARVKHRIRTRLVGSVLDRAFAVAASERTGELAHTAGDGVDALDQYYAQLLPGLGLGLLAPPMIVAWTCVVDPLSGAVLAVTVPLVPLFAWLVGASAGRRARQRWAVLSLLSAHFLDVVEGLPTLRGFGRGRAQRETIRRVTERYRTAAMGTLKLAFLSSLVLELAATAGTALLAVEVGLRLVQGTLGLEAGLTVLLLAPEAHLAMRRLATQFHAGADAMAAARRIFQILDEGPPRARPTSAPPPDLRTATLRLERVSFHRPDRAQAVLHEVCLDIRPGDRIAITGPSGGGKSTLLALLLAFLQPSAGRIAVAGRSIADLDPEVWRRQVGWLPQRPHLFSGTVADNIRLGDPAARDDHLWHWLDLAGGRAWIADLPDGLQTRIGEQGARLSGGQRQRIALARTLARRSPLLLLDEPTANLDGETAGSILTSLARLPAPTTCLVVTHDAGLLGRAGRVLRLEAGALGVEPPAAPVAT